MKIPKRLILKVAIRIIDERGAASQYDIHSAIAEYLNRQLTVGEKVRITKILESELNIRERKRDNKGIRVYIFIR